MRKTDSSDDILGRVDVFRKSPLIVADLIFHGCLNEIVVWEGVNVDGHNRYQICKENSIPFEIKGVNFSSREEAESWIITNQPARRSIPKFKGSELIEMRKDINSRRKAAERRRLSNIRRGETSCLPAIGKSTDSQTGRINMQVEPAEEMGIPKGTVSKMQVVKKTPADIRARESRDLVSMPIPEKERVCHAMPGIAETAGKICAALAHTIEHPLPGNMLTRDKTDEGQVLDRTGMVNDCRVKVENSVFKGQPIARRSEKRGGAATVTPNDTLSKVVREKELSTPADLEEARDRIEDGFNRDVVCDGDTGGLGVPGTLNPSIDGYRASTMLWNCLDIVGPGCIKRMCLSGDSGRWPQLIENPPGRTLKASKPPLAAETHHLISSNGSYWNEVIWSLLNTLFLNNDRSGMGWSG